MFSLMAVLEKMMATAITNTYETTCISPFGNSSPHEIQQVVNERGIDYLLHFTRLCNVPGILQHGLYPRSRLDELPHAAVINDRHRFDNRTDSNSLSLGHPNDAMFYKYRQSTLDDWAVLVIEPSVLWESGCAYSKYNAADHRISGLPLKALTSGDALRGMFDESDCLSSRAAQKLHPFDPTDHQAEVLIFDVISPSKIRGAVFRNEEALYVYASKYPQFKFACHEEGTGVFARRDFVR